MKTLEELTHEEYIQLTDDQIEEFAKVECAMKGVKMLPKPEKIDRKFFEKTKEIYEVGGHLTTSKKAAEEIAVVMNKHANELVEEKYDWRTGYDYKYVLPYTDKTYNVNKIFYFEEEAIKKNEDYLIKINNAKTIYDKEINDYNNSRDAIIRIKNAIYEKFYEAKKLENDILRHKAIYAEYETIAKGDKAMAIEFYKKAHEKDIAGNTELLNRLDFLNEAGMISGEGKPIE